MSTNDVPGAKPENHDVLMLGCWAEHDDGSLIFVEAVEGGTVVYSIFDIQDPPVEYRDAMPETGFKERFSWRPGDNDPDNIRWTWHNRIPFDWSRVMEGFPSGQRHVSARQQMTAAERVARSLRLRAETVTERPGRPTFQRAASKILDGLRDAVGALRP